MKFRSDAHSLLFYAHPSGNQQLVQFVAHEYQTENPTIIDALTSDRAKASGITEVEG